ncbi:MAG: hypothetical protein JOZ97_00915 [Candidatus Eremiobacteraeota bacterium]|nr:hypothetical protein [Candidatus Eremiobacteraeota bacterium]
MRSRVRRDFSQLKGYMHRSVTLAVSVFVFLSIGAVAPATAQTPTPHPFTLPTPHLPTTPLHTEFVVEVNRLGQIVRVKSGKSCKNLTFNAQTYGNVLQMWIRKPNGQAIVGLYRVTYDYNPQTQKVHRGVALLSRGGNWGNQKGAVTDMLIIDAKNRAQHRGLPGLNQLIRPTPTPKPK